MRLRVIQFVFLGLLLFRTGEDGRAQETPPSEYELKAAYLFNFMKFVEWPEEAFAKPDSAMVIGVLGDNPFGRNLEDAVRNKTINGRRLVVKKAVPLAEAHTCHVLFISTSERRRLSEIFETLGTASILTIGETDRFTENGGVINFVVREKKLRFQINREAARKAGLKISSKLLTLAVATD